MVHNRKRPKSPVLTVDGVILEKGKVLLVKRNHPPFVGQWVLLGGHVEYGERVEEAVKREMKEELGIKVEIKSLLGVYSDPKRDPRQHTVGVAYLLERVEGNFRVDREATEFKFFPLNKLPARLGFDHREMLSDLKKHLR